MATSVRGLRAIMRASHVLSGIALRPIQFNRDMAPMISICRMSAWPAFVTRPSRSLPPDENWRGTNPSHRSEEHTSELQSLMRISYAVFCLKKKKNTKNNSSKKHYQINKEKKHNNFNQLKHKRN